MTLTIELAPELEAELRDEAAKLGMDPNGFVLSTVRERLRVSRPVPHLSKAETGLLEAINQQWPVETQAHFDRLVARRRARKITPEELAELIAWTDRSERQAAERVRAVTELARLRGVPFDGMWQQLRGDA